MAKQLVEYDYDGSTILVEVEQEKEEEEWERVGVLDHLPIVKAKVSFEKALSAIRPVTKAVMTQVSNLDTKPEKVEVGFGLTMKAEGGAVIASAGIEANMNVKLTWDLKGA